MRAGVCTVQQTLGADAAGAVKQAVALARRRGHAQVTPLHVAATLLTSRSSLLRRACMKSQPHPTSHPLQCRALELCFNVALNRLPTTAGPLLQSQPSLSNALVAALKRAQAHQRRGCLDQQQQQPPLLAIKVELDQLIISILDDPSVSRVMREAGFSSTSVKNNLEDAVSFLNSYTSAIDAKEIFPLGSGHSQWAAHWANFVSLNTLKQSHPFLVSENPFVNSSFLSPNWKTGSMPLEREDLRMVIDVLLLRRKINIVLVGDSVSSTEGLVSELKRKIEAGDVPDDLRSVKFLAVEFSNLSIKIMKREDVESWVSDLRRVVRNFGTSGVIVYVGNLKWVVPDLSEKDAVCRDYNPTEHLISEIARLLSEFSHQSKLWFLGTANTHTYLRCQMRQPSLESQWTLQAVPIPSRCLSLSLHSASGLDSAISASHAQQSLHQTQILKPAFTKDDEYDKFVLCLECATSYEKEVKILLNDEQHSPNETENQNSDFPYWLRPYNKTDTHKDGSYRQHVELKKKWIKLCQSLNHSPQNQIQRKPGEWFDCMSLGESSGRFNGTPPQTPSSGWAFPWRCNSPPNGISKVTEGSPEVKTTLALGIVTEGRVDRPTPNGFKDDDFHKNAKAFLPCNWVAECSSKTGSLSNKELCKELVENVPWQSKTILGIARAISEPTNEWFLLAGSDRIGKRRLAMTVANSMFGSLDNTYLAMNAAEGSVEKIIEYLKSNPRGLILIEDIDCAEESFLGPIRNAVTGENLRDSNGREFAVAGSTILLTTGSSSANLRKQKMGVIQMNLQVSNDQADGVKGNEMRKRKSETVKSNTSEEGSRKKQCTNFLDLNMLAQEEEEEEEEDDATHESITMVSGDSTQETRQHSNVDQDNTSVPNWFLSKIRQRFTLDLPVDSNPISDDFRVKLQKGFTEVVEDRRWQFHIEKEVLEELVCASCSFHNSLMEDWIKDVLQRDIKIIKKLEREERIKVRLCLQSEKERVSESGYQGSPLPKRIDVSFDYQTDYKLSMKDADS